MSVDFNVGTITEVFAREGLKYAANVVLLYDAIDSIDVCCSLYPEYENCIDGEASLALS